MVQHKARGSRQTLLYSCPSEPPDDKKIDIIQRFAKHRRHIKCAKCQMTGHIYHDGGSGKTPFKCTWTDATGQKCGKCSRYEVVHLKIQEIEKEEKTQAASESTGAEQVILNDKNANLSHTHTTALSTEQDPGSATKDPLPTVEELLKENAALRSELTTLRAEKEAAYKENATLQTAIEELKSKQETASNESKASRNNMTRLEKKIEVIENQLEQMKNCVGSNQAPFTLPWDQVAAIRGRSRSNVRPEHNSRPGTEPVQTSGASAAPKHRTFAQIVRGWSQDQIEALKALRRPPPPVFSMVYAAGFQRRRLSELRAMLRKVGIPTQRIINLAYPGGSIVEFMTHASFRKELIDHLGRAGFPAIENYDVTSFRNVRDPKWSTRSMEERTEKAREIYAKRLADIHNSVREDAARHWIRSLASKQGILLSGLDSNRTSQGNTTAPQRDTTEGVHPAVDTVEPEPVTAQEATAPPTDEQQQTTPPEGATIPEKSGVDAERDGADVEESRPISDNTTTDIAAVPMTEVDVPQEEAASVHSQPSNSADEPCEDPSPRCEQQPSV
jgi:predicted nuclease with TOPRIM domain